MGVDGGCACASTWVAGGCLALELDRVIRERDTREDTRPTGDHVLRPHADPFSEHRTARYPRALADAATGPDDAVAQLAARADLGVLEDHRALHRAPRAEAPTA